MNDFTNHNSTNPDPTQSKPSPAVPRQNQSNFDVLDYVRLSSKPASLPAHTDLTSSDASSIPYGELDPYVDPAELLNTPMPSQKNSIELANQSLEKMEALENAIDQLETESMPLQSPAVEINSASQNADMEPSLGDAEFEEIPVAFFVKASDENSNEKPIATMTPLSAVPIINPETGETMFDVRDFEDLAHVSIEPIPCAFEVDRDLFDFHTVEDLPTEAKPTFLSPASLEQDGNHELYINPVDDGQVFIAGEGDVIEVNGADGFDHIDLACFDVSCADFSDQVIKVANEHGKCFEVHYQDIDYALFADGVEVRLNPQVS